MKAKRLRWKSAISVSVLLTVGLTGCFEKPQEQGPTAAELEALRQADEAQLALEETQKAYLWQAEDVEQRSEALEEQLQSLEKELQARKDAEMQARLTALREETERLRAEGDRARAESERIAREVEEIRKATPVVASVQATPQEWDPLFRERLSPHGDWVNVAGYGDCWDPRIGRRSDWRPYLDGSWGWSDQGWSWVSNEPFGWATYHYGRWVRVARFGWVWVPDTEWAPAWVAWRSSNSHVGWAPLPPEPVGSSWSRVGRDCDSRYRLQATQYVFVPVNQFVTPTYQHVHVAPVQVTQIYQHTVNVTQIECLEGQVHRPAQGHGRLFSHVGGPDRGWINRTCRDQVPAVRPRLANGTILASQAGRLTGRDPAEAVHVTPPRQSPSGVPIKQEPVVAGVSELEAQRQRLQQGGSGWARNVQVPEVRVAEPIVIPPSPSPQQGLDTLRPSGRGRGRIEQLRRQMAAVSDAAPLDDTGESSGTDEEAVPMGSSSPVESQTGTILVGGAEAVQPVVAPSAPSQPVVSTVESSGSDIRPGQLPTRAQLLSEGRGGPTRIERIRSADTVDGSRDDAAESSVPIVVGDPEAESGVEAAIAIMPTSDSEAEGSSTSSRLGDPRGRRVGPNRSEPAVPVDVPNTEERELSTLESTGAEPAVAMEQEQEQKAEEEALRQQEAMVAQQAAAEEEARQQAMSAQRQAEEMARAQAEEEALRQQEAMVAQQAASEEEARQQAMAAQRQAEEMAKAQSEEEALRQQEAMAAQQAAAEEEARQQAMAAQRQAEEMAKAQAEQEALRQQEAMAAQQAAAEEEARQQAMAAQRQAEEMAKAQAEEEALRQQQAMAAQQAAAEEEARQQAMAAQRQAEEMARAQAEEEALLQQEAMAAQQAAAEEQARRQQMEAQRQAEEAARRAAEEQARQQQMEAQRRAEEAARRAAEEQARQQQMEAQRQAEEAARRAAEEQMRRQAEEAQRQAQEAARRAAEEQMRRQAEEAQRQAQEAARRAAEEAARQQAAQGQ